MDLVPEQSTFGLSLQCGTYEVAVLNIVAQDTMR